MPDSRLTRREQEVVTAATSLLDKVLKRGGLGPVQQQQVKQLLSVLKALPGDTFGINVSLTVASPWRTVGPSRTQFYWTVEAFDGEVNISNGGYHYAAPMLGDSFTLLQWRHGSGEVHEWYDEHRIAPYRVRREAHASPRHTIKWEVSHATERLV